MSDANPPTDPDDEPIPKLPRAPLWGKLSLPAMVRVGMFATMLYAIIVMRQPCADGMGRFISGFDDPPDAGPASVVDHYPGYELLTTEELLKRYPLMMLDAGVADAGPRSE